MSRVRAHTHCHVQETPRTAAALHPDILPAHTWSRHPAQTRASQHARRQPCMWCALPRRSTASLSSSTSTPHRQHTACRCNLPPAHHHRRHQLLPHHQHHLLHHHPHQDARWLSPPRPIDRAPTSRRRRPHGKRGRVPEPPPLPTTRSAAPPPTDCGGRCSPTPESSAPPPTTVPRRPAHTTPSPGSLFPAAAPPPPPSKSLPLCATPPALRPAAAPRPPRTRRDASSSARGAGASPAAPAPPPLAPSVPGPRRATSYVSTPCKHGI